MDDVAVLLGLWRWLALAVAIVGVPLAFIFWRIGHVRPDAGVAPWRSLWREFWPLAVAFAAVAVAAAVLTTVAARIDATAHPTLHDAATAFAVATIQGLVFFGIFGFVVILVQRREYERNRNLEDRIDLLFNAKSLTSEERSFLKASVATVACDFRSDETTVELLELDDASKLLKLRVTRSFRVGNYLKDHGADYALEVSLEGDAMPDDRDAIVLYPINSTLFADDGGAGRRLSDDETLSERMVAKSGQPVVARPKYQPIGVGEIREMRSGFEGWQRLKGDKGQPEAYVITVERHWDKMDVHVVNNLASAAKIKIIDWRGPATVEVGPNDRRQSAWSANNVAQGQTVRLEFEPITNI